MKIKLIIIIIVVAASFFAGYKLGDFKIADSKITILDGKSVCPYLRKNSSINSESECPYLNKNKNAENNCPYLEGKIQKNESRKKLLKTV